MGLDRSKVNSSRKSYLTFVQSLETDNVSFQFTSKSELTPYARCFAIFGYHLLLETERLQLNVEDLVFAIRRDLDSMRQKRISMGVRLNCDKPYLQLLSFSLSALFILNRLDSEPLEDHVLPLLTNDIELALTRSGALVGTPRSGNQAMFMAILLYHANEYLGQDTTDLLANWQKIHICALNRFGFWGQVESMSHLQFQNGYHQYEILDYFQTKDVPWPRAADNVADLADAEGHFAPYPGGGGCYDYDAVYLLTGAGSQVTSKYCDLLKRTANTILSEQNSDGGFCESIRVRPRSFGYLSRSARHVYSARGIARIERLRHAVTLLRPKHDRIHTHWCNYSRRWNESDLWDSWFRMLTVARIDVALDSTRISKWGFIDYPGIGFHHLLRDN